MTGSAPNDAVSTATVRGVGPWPFLATFLTTRFRGETASLVDGGGGGGGSRSGVPLLDGVGGIGRTLGDGALGS